MSDYMRIIDVRGRGLTEQELTTVRVLGSDEDYVTYRTKPPRHLEIDYEIRAKNKEELRKKIDAVSAIIETTEKVPIIFPDEPDMTYYGEYAGAEQSVEYHHVGIHRGTIYILRDPYKYGPEKTVETTSDTFNIENAGTAEAEPIIELTATQKATFAMVTLGDEQYNLLGEPADDDVQIVDSRTSVLYEDGSTIGDWQVATSQMIDEHHIEIAGEMGADVSGIRAIDYGAGDGIHGPAVFKEIDPIQDFEIEATFDINSTRVSDSWRMGINFLDENLNMLGHIGLKDNSVYYQRRTPLARFGEWRGSGRQNGNLLGDANKIDNSRNLTLFYLRVKRVGNTFDFYIAEWRGAKHERSWHEVYRDVNNEYMGRLKYITLYIGNYADRYLPSRLRINSVEVFELTKATVDQTPYIIYPGDIVEFDHVTKDIRLNGESRKDLKNFGGSFFTLKKGINTLTVTPENTFNTKITYRERYK